jgi:hypothetical protein
MGVRVWRVFDVLHQDRRLLDLLGNPCPSHWKREDPACPQGHSARPGAGTSGVFWSDKLSARAPALASPSDLFVKCPLEVRHETMPSSTTKRCATTTSASYVPTAVSTTDVRATEYGAKGQSWSNAIPEPRLLGAAPRSQVPRKQRA